MSPTCDPSVIEYARQQGIVIDHTTIDPLRDTDTLQTLSIDDLHLSQYAPPKLQQQSERLRVTKDVVKLLSQACTQPEKSGHEAFLTRRELAKERKFEMPLLRTDHELDMLEYQQTVATKPEDHFSECREEEQELLKMLKTSEAEEALYARVQKRIANVKPRLSRDATLVLQNSVMPLPKEDIKRFIIEIERSNKSMTRSPISSPLMPVFAEPKLPDMGQLEALEPLDLEEGDLQNDLRRVNVKILQRDGMNLGVHSSNQEKPGIVKSDELLDMFPALECIKKQPSNPIVDWNKASQLKIWEPLAPRSPTCKGRLDQILEDSFSSISLDIPSAEEFINEDFDSCFKEMKSFAAKVDHAIKHEHFNQRRLIQKIDQPPLDAEKPVAPWEAFKTTDEQLKERLGHGFLSEIQEDCITKYSWPITLEEERALSWVPWAPYEFSMADIESRYKIQEDAALLKTLLTPPEPLDPRTLPRISTDGDLFGESELNELERGELPDPNGFSMLVRKRKLLLQGEEKAKDDSLAVQRRPGMVQGQHPLEGVFSNLGLDLLGDPAKAIKRLRLANEDNEPARCLKAPYEPVVNEQGGNTSKDLLFPGSEPRIADYQRHRSTNALNDLQTTLRLEPAYFVVSSTIMKQRSLFRLISQSYPSATFIERELGLATERFNRQSVEINGDASVSPELDFEVDLILSPTTGLLVTSVQRLQQRSLPGQKRLPLMQARLAAVAPKYESLYLLVTDNQVERIPTLAPDSSAISAISEITAFTQSHYFRSLHTEVSVVACFGREEDLAQWIVRLMDKHSSQLGGVTLTHEETKWELWLRRAGLNPLAAQVVLLGSASIGASTPQCSSLLPALPTFLLLDPLERESMFSSILGENILHRLNMTLLSLWS